MSDDLAYWQDVAEARLEELSSLCAELAKYEHPLSCSHKTRYLTSSTPNASDLKCAICELASKDAEIGRLKEESVIGDLLGELDSIARDVDNYDYGLPLYNEEQHGRERMITAVREWLAGRDSKGVTDDQQ